MRVITVFVALSSFRAICSCTANRFVWWIKLFSVFTRVSGGPSATKRRPRSLRSSSSTWQ